MLNSRIDRFIQHLGLSYNEFERSIDAGRGSISGAIKNDRNLGSQIVESILHKYDELSADWLLRNRGEMLNKSGGLVSEDAAKYEKQKVSTSKNPLLNELIEQLNEKVKLKKVKDINDVLTFIKNFDTTYGDYESENLRLLRLESTMAKLIFELEELKQIKKL
tara:strand:- start:8267 stop:8755 length:489 start_codon:yes stop_codon:yes gene_type:complete